MFKNKFSKLIKAKNFCTGQPWDQATFYARSAISMPARCLHNVIYCNPSFICHFELCNPDTEIWQEVDGKVQTYTLPYGINFYPDLVHEQTMFNCSISGKSKNAKMQYVMKSKWIY